MKARDVMVSPVVTVNPDATVRDVAKLLMKHRISALPVVDGAGKLAGIVSEGDLMHRAEIGTERRHSWWHRLLVEDQAFAAEYIKTHASKVKDVMTRQVISAAPDTPLDEIARLLEKHSIKRVPIVQDGKVVGIVSRANLVQALASSGGDLEVRLSDVEIRTQLLGHLKEQNWAHPGMLNVTVNNGVVDLWGISNSETEKKAIHVAAEAVAGVRGVNDHVIVRTLQSME